ncbi:MAG: hypothetical protein JKY81_11925 [Colwellia sp.]|nr:hypothetical protein [Colwellia sp.]
MKKVIGIIIATMFISGCGSTLKPKVDHLELVRDGNYNHAEQIIVESVAAEGSNKLLHYLEMGMLAHLQGNYQKSNQLFDQAERISEELYTTSISDIGLESITGASFSSYKGLNFEQTFVGYYKALNYLKLAETQDKFSESDLDRALVEVRRLGNRLTELTTKTGGYQEKTDEDESPIEMMLGFLKEALGASINSDELAYKDDAFAHYLSGMLFEISGDLDAARVEYEKSAHAYENGFAENYKLGKKGAAQVWYDTARVMKIAGGYDEKLRKISKKHLTSKQRKLLKSVNAKSSELVVIQHLGFAPQKKQLNMTLTAEAHSKSLVLTPVPMGTEKEKQDQLHWFKMLYADNDLFTVMKNYASGDLHAVATANVTKRISLGPLWGRAEELGLISALSIPSRVAVSYYPSMEKTFIKSELFINGKLASELYQGNNIARIALQEQLNVANTQIQLALAREITKAILAEKTAAAAGQWGAIAGIGLKALNAATASADTRNWTTLPGAIKFARVTLPPGEHKLVLKTQLSSGRILEQSQVVKTTKHRPKMWHTRTLSRLPKPELTTNTAIAETSKQTSTE